MPCVCAKLLQSCPTLCDPIDGSPPGSAVPGILQARTLEWVAIAFCNRFAQFLLNLFFYFIYCIIEKEIYYFIISFLLVIYGKL